MPNGEKPKEGASDRESGFHEARFSPSDEVRRVTNPLANLAASPVLSGSSQPRASAVVPVPLVMSMTDAQVQAAIIQAVAQAQVAQQASAQSQPSSGFNSKLIPDYSGHNPGQKYVGRDGKESTEVYEVGDWLFQVQNAGAVHGWAKDKWILAAKVKLVPQTPAWTWLKVAEDLGADLSTWDSFEAAIRTEFSLAINAIERVRLLHTFVHKKNETVNIFRNKLTLNHDKFLKDLDKEFEAAPFDQETDDELMRRLLVIKIVTNYYARAFFLAGLKEDILAQVTISGEESFDDVFEHARRTELALNMKRNAPISATAGKDFKDAVAAEVQRLFQSQQPGAGGVSATAGKSGGKPAGKDKQRDLSSVTCFYCGQKGHYPDTCSPRAADRASGNWRPTVRCPKSSKEQWDKMSRDERGKGATLFGKPRQSNVSSNDAQSPPAQGAANSTSYAGAIGGATPRRSRESMFSDWAHSSSV